MSGLAPAHAQDRSGDALRPLDPLIVSRVHRYWPRNGAPPLLHGLFPLLLRRGMLCTRRGRHDQVKWWLGQDETYAPGQAAVVETVHLDDGNPGTALRIKPRTPAAHLGDS